MPGPGRAGGPDPVVRARAALFTSLREAVKIGADESPIGPGGSASVTPAILAARRAGVPHRVLEYAHDPRSESYGLEAAAALGLAPESVFKTLVVALDGGGLAVAMVPVDRQVDLKAVAAALGAKRAEMADPAAAERATGYVLGGISPLGQKKKLPAAIDASVEALDTVHVSAGRRGVEIALAPDQLVRLTGALVAPIARPDPGSG